MKTYMIGLIRGRTTRYLRLRETNFRRACKALRTLLIGNKRYKSGEVCSVEADTYGIEHSPLRLYTKK